MPKKLITSTIVEETDRNMFMVTHFPTAYMKVENGIYNTMDKFCKDYRGGYWDFVELSNGGGYMSLETEAPDGMQVSCDNYYRGVMTLDAASITANLYAINKAVWDDPDNEALVNQYYFLRDFALEHKERDKILGAID
jgi:hypothetical protein